MKSYVDALGNLTLISIPLNSRAQRSVISKKMVEYKKSKLPVTKRLVKEMEKSGTKWGEKSIADRQRRFAMLAREKIWSP